jgi:hypothetical protein
MAMPHRFTGDAYTLDDNEKFLAKACEFQKDHPLCCMVLDFQNVTRILFSTRKLRLILVDVGFRVDNALLGRHAVCSL